MSSGEKSSKASNLFLKVAAWCLTEGNTRLWKKEIAWKPSKKASYKLFSKEKEKESKKRDI
jgi:hypothetical protein